MAKNPDKEFEKREFKRKKAEAERARKFDEQARLRMFRAGPYNTVSR